VDSPEAIELAAALASTRELLEVSMRNRWPHLLKKALLTVPLYPDTTEEEWLAIYRKHKERHVLLQQRDSEPKKRIHKDELNFRLQVFDSHRELKNFTQVGQRLGHPESNVRRAFGKVFFDIYGSGLPRRVKERRAANFDVAGHMETCEVCRKLVTDDVSLNRTATSQKLCRAAQAYLDVDVKALREVLSDH
jgi:hypothetical protein